MKRIALLTVLLLVVGLSLGFAQEFKPAVTWATSGSATLTWGINLDTMETGFTNAAAATLSLTLVPETTLTKGADAAVYGWISLGTFKWVDGTWTQPSVTAKIVAKPLEFGVYGVPALTTAVTGAIETAADSVLEATETALAAPAYGTTGGTYVAYISDVFTVKAKLDSVGDWTRTEDTIINYAGGIDGTVAVKPVTVGFGVYDGFWTGAVPAGYVTLGLAAAPITVGVKADFNLDTTVAYDLSATVGLALDKLLSLDVAVAYGDNFNGLDLKAVFGLKAVENLTETLTVYVLDVGAVAPMTMEYEVINALSYAVKIADGQTVTPALTVTYGYNYETDDTILTAVASVAAAVIPNTTLTLTYTSGDFIVVAPDRKSVV